MLVTADMIAKAKKSLLDHSEFESFSKAYDVKNEADERTEQWEKTRVLAERLIYLFETKIFEEKLEQAKEKKPDYSKKLEQLRNCESQKFF